MINRQTSNYYIPKISVSCYLAVQRNVNVFMIPCGIANSESANRLHRMSLLNLPVNYRSLFQPLAALQSCDLMWTLSHGQAMELYSYDF